MTHHYFTGYRIECLQGVQLAPLANGITADKQTANEEYQEGAK